jgi:ABC-type oligopeptide transport system ATPase subunit
MSILQPAVIQALQETELIQKHDRLCDLAAIDAIPIKLLQVLTLNNQISIAKQSTTAERILLDLIHRKSGEVYFNEKRLVNVSFSRHKKICLSVLQNPNITKDILLVLSDNKSMDIRRKVQFHIQTPGEILLEFKQYPRWWKMCRGSGSLEEKVASHYSTSPNLLRKFSQHKDWQVRAAVAGNPATPSDVLLFLADEPLNYKIHRTSDIIRSLAKNPATPVDILRRPSVYTYDFSCVATNPSIPVDILDELVRIDFCGVMSALSNNPSTPSHVLVRIASSCPSDRNHILTNIAKHPNTPILIKIDIIKKGLVRCIDTLLRVYVDAFNDHEMKNNFLFAIQSIIMKYPNHVLKECENYKDSSPINILEKLSQHENTAFKQVVRSHLRSIYRELAANPETSTEQLWEMLYHRDIEIRLSVLLHPQGLNLLLDRSLQVENSLNRFIAGLHPQLSTIQRDRLFYSDNWFDRLAIACNPSTSIEYLQRLSQDNHDLIRDIAIQKIPN